MDKEETPWTQRVSSLEGTRVNSSDNEILGLSARDERKKKKKETTQKDKQLLQGKKQDNFLNRRNRVTRETRLPDLNNFSDPFETS